MHKKRKAPGPEDTPVKLLKFIDPDTHSSRPAEHNIRNRNYTKGMASINLRGINQEKNGEERADHRTISLMSHTLKIFLKIIHTKRCLQEIS